MIYDCDCMYAISKFNKNAFIELMSQSKNTYAVWLVTKTRTVMAVIRCRALQNCPLHIDTVVRAGGRANDDCSVFRFSKPYTVLHLFLFNDVDDDDQSIGMQQIAAAWQTTLSSR